MQKLPWIPFYVNDWLADRDLQRCELSTRGVWIQLLALMWQDGQSGQITGTARELARLCSCDRAEVVAAIHELKRTGTGDIQEHGEGDPVYVVQNRRMRREWKKREGSRIRKQRQRAKNSSDGDQCENPPPTDQSRLRPKKSRDASCEIASGCAVGHGGVTAQRPESESQDLDQTLGEAKFLGGAETDGDGAAEPPAPVEPPEGEVVDIDAAKRRSQWAWYKLRQTHDISRTRSDRVLMLTLGHLVETQKIPLDQWESLVCQSTKKENPASWLCAVFDQQLGGTMRRWQGVVSRAVPEADLRTRRVYS